MLVDWKGDNGIMETKSESPFGNGTTHFKITASQLFIPDALELKVIDI